MQPSELSRQLLQTQEAERKRISRELHDGTGQGLMVLRLYLAMLASEEQSSEAQAKIREALKLLDATVEDLRRIIRCLSPRALDELGLLPALRKEVQEVAKISGMRARVELPIDLRRLDRELELALYRTLQEALHNVVKHAGAQAFAVRLTHREGMLCLSVEDDGLGIRASRRCADHPYGLVGMRERLAALGGTVQIRARRSGGTCVKMTLPVPVADAAPKQAIGERRLANVIEYVPRSEQNWTSDQPMAMSAKSRKKPAIFE